MRSEDTDVVRTGYMCRVDFEFELGAALGGNVIFPDIEDLRAHRKCVDECGIVEVEVRLKKLIEPGREPGAYVD